VAGTGLEVADVLRRYLDAYEQRYGRLSPPAQRMVHDLLVCRTPALGGHRYVCDHCARVTERYNSCRNRHCPKCQNLERERWLERRGEELLPVPYFHLVFTVPHSLNPLFLTERRALCHLLFRSAAEALLTLARDPRRLGARIGFLAVLHTWSQRLELHPHLHVIVPGGGLAPDGERWIASRPDFFLRVEPLAALFRGKLLDALGRAARQGQRLFPRRLDPRAAPEAYRSWRQELYATSWNVYSKPPFRGAQGGLDYLGRYTHRVAISNHRLLALEEDRVLFRYRDSRDGDRSKVTSLDGVEFVRRFLMHRLPVGFQRIRSYGLFANRHRAANLERCRELLGVARGADDGSPSAAESPEGDEETLEEEILRLTGLDPLQCPACRKGRLQLLPALPARQEGLAVSARAPP